MKFEIGDVINLLNTTTDLFNPVTICKFKIVKIKKNKVKLICLSTEQELFTSIEWLNQNIIV